MNILYTASSEPLVSDPQLYEYYEALMPRSRREKTAKLRSLSGRAESVAAWALLTRSLTDSGLLSSPELPSFAELSYGVHGRPYMTHFSGLDFSLSHSHGRVMCIVSDEGRVSCDLEQLRPDAPIASISKRFFSPSEQKQLASTDLSEEERKLLFFRIWTLKECILKGTGRGMNLSLTDFAFDLSGSLPKFTASTDAADGIPAIPDDSMPLSMFTFALFREYELAGYACSACLLPAALQSNDAHSKTPSASPHQKILLPGELTDISLAR